MAAAALAIGEEVVAAGAVGVVAWVCMVDPRLSSQAVFVCRGGKRRRSHHRQLGDGFGACSLKRCEDLIRSAVGGTS